MNIGAPGIPIILNILAGSCLSLPGMMIMVIMMIMVMAMVIVRCDDLGLLGRCKRIPARQATKEEVVLIIEDIVGDIMINVDDKCSTAPDLPQC